MPALLKAGCQGKRDLSNSSLRKICRCRKDKRSKYQFFFYLFSTMKVLMDKKESRIASSWVFVYCIRSQWQSGALTWSHRDWQMVTTSWQEKQRERQEKISHLPRFQWFQNHSHRWRSLIWLVAVHSSAPPPQHSYRHDTSAALRSQSQLCNVLSTSRVIMLHDALK